MLKHYHSVQVTIMDESDSKTAAQHNELNVYTGCIVDGDEASTISPDDQLDSYTFLCTPGKFAATHVKIEWRGDDGVTDVVLAEVVIVGKTWG